jgi:hypothetical protein
MTTNQVHPDAAAADAAARAMAAWLAPYIAAEMERIPAPSSVRGNESTYDEAVCAEFVSSLGDKVLLNSGAFFTALDERGKIGSLELAALLDVRSPRNIPAVLTTPLKRRARSLGLAYPWQESADHTNRTVWLSIDGVTKPMLAAAEAEIERRNEGVR